MWWVATENSILMYCPLRHCRELRYFNFAVMSGLDKPALRRLHSTWERVSGKYIRMLEDVQQLVDPLRNIQILAEVSQNHQFALCTVVLWIVTTSVPKVIAVIWVVPIYPVIRKDLTFSHEGNEGNFHMNIQHGCKEWEPNK
ncbi:hypothetical protein COOONC_25969 [Cooperia oncophora]